jgi:hypothetical protein
MNPLHLLTLEWKRFAPNATIRIVVALYLVVFGLVTYAARLIGNTLAMTPADYLFVPPVLWEFIAYAGSWLNFSLLGLCGVFLITTDWTHRTLRQSVIFGMKRGEVASAKIVSAIALAFAATGTYLIVCIVAAWLINTPADVAPANLWDALHAAGPFFLQALGCVLLGLLFGAFIRQTALATLAYLAYIFVLESLLRWIVLLTVVKTRALLFLPDSLFESLTPFPMPALADRVGRAYQIIAPLQGNEILLGSAVWIVVTALIIHWKICRADL